MAASSAILNLWGKMRSNYKIVIKYEFLDQKNLIMHTIISYGDQIVQKLIFKMADGGHVGFEGDREVKWQN